MDNTKHNQPAAAQDSDDLIAELARLVAQDARNTSSQSDAYKRQEPNFAPTPAPVDPVQNDFYEAESSFGVPGECEPEIEPEAPAEPAADESDLLPGFDFAPNQEPAAAADPIAELIADAEVEAYDRDFAQDTGWTEESGQGVQASDFDEFAPEQTYGQTNDLTIPAHEQPSPAPTRDERDPLSEIEALIGEAARVNVGAADGGMPGRRVRSSFLEDGETDAAVDAAESAILAAAAATGAPVRRVEPSESENWFAPHEPQRVEPEERIEEPEPAPAPDYHPDPLFAPAADPEHRAAEDAPVFEDEDTEFVTERPRRKLNGFVLPVAAGVAIVALIGGVYFTFFSGPPAPGEAPVLTADAQPLKEEAAPTNTETAASDSVVFNEIEGNTASPEDEALVSRDQTGGASGAEVAEVLAPEEGEMELVNRPVRTVTVRPDGTIVQAEDSVAGSNVLPVDRPDVPAVPNSTLTSDPIGEAIAQAMAGEAVATAEAPEQVASLNATAAPAVEATTEEPAVETPAAEDPNAPTPIPRPAGLTASGEATASSVETPTAASAAPTVSTAETALASAPTQTQTAAPAAAATAEPAAWVQLASQRSEEVAQAGVAELQAAYGTLFGGAQLEVSRVDLGERGIYYRVRLPQPSLADANTVCSAIQAQGGDCFVMDN